MAILKYIYLSSGLILYVVFNFISYTNANYAGPLPSKIFFSGISFIFLMICYVLILMPEKVTKRSFNDFSLHFKIIIYIGVIISPMMSLYYTNE